MSLELRSFTLLRGDGLRVDLLAAEGEGVRGVTVALVPVLATPEGVAPIAIIGVQGVGTLAAEQFVLVVPLEPGVDNVGSPFAGYQIVRGGLVQGLGTVGAVLPGIVPLVSTYEGHFCATPKLHPDEGGIRGT